jgi:hypothetical protein
MKLCKDCKHFKHIRGTPYDACHDPEARREPVSGTAFAEFERRDGNCGPEGKLFEPKPIGFFGRLFSYSGD